MECLYQCVLFSLPTHYCSYIFILDLVKEKSLLQSSSYFRNTWHKWIFYVKLHQNKFVQILSIQFNLMWRLQGENNVLNLVREISIVKSLPIEKRKILKSKYSLNMLFVHLECFCITSRTFRMRPERCIYPLFTSQIAWMCFPPFNIRTIWILNT